MTQNALVAPFYSKILFLSVAQSYIPQNLPIITIFLRKAFHIKSLAEQIPPFHLPKASPTL